MSYSEEFTRAVYVATDIKLSHHLVNTVFRIFDEDHDGKLSHKEFIGIMKDRLHRGDRVRQPRSYKGNLPLLYDTEGDGDGVTAQPPSSSASQSSTGVLASGLHSGTR